MVGKTHLEWDTAAFEAALKAKVPELEKAAERKVFALALRVQRTARGYCPVDTGRLRNSIGVEQGRDAQGYYVTVGTNVSYAVFVEFGTRASAAQPFLRPALLLELRKGLGK